MSYSTFSFYLAVTDAGHVTVDTSDSLTGRYSDDHYPLTDHYNAEAKVLDRIMGVGGEGDMPSIPEQLRRLANHLERQDTPGSPRSTVRANRMLNRTAGSHLRGRALPSAQELAFPENLGE